MKKEEIKEKLKEYLEGELLTIAQELIDGDYYEITDDGHLILQKMEVGLGFDEILYNFTDNN